MSPEEQEKEEHAQDLTAGGAGRSSAPDTRGAEEDLPPDLKAIEAELASLSPRTDRLDRERLIFLAGQESVLAQGGMKGTVPFSLRENRDSPLRENRDSPLRENRDSPRLFWPAAFAAMTAVAAMLLVMLLLQPETQGEVPFVEVPGDRPGADDVGPDGNLPTSPPDRQPVDGLPGPQEPSPKPAPRSSLFASVGWDWLQLSDRGQLESGTPYPRLLDQLLREGIDSWPSPAPVVSTDRASGPVGYRELLNKELGKPAPNRPLPERPLIHTLFYPGANS